MSNAPATAVVVLLVSATSLSCMSSPSSTAPIAGKLDALFAEWNKPDSAGCSLGVSRHGDPVYLHGYGLASVELKVPITADSVFHVASIAKQFTAMSIMLLAQRGKLSIDDQARKYIPELPDYGTPLTVRHLLNHRSGLRDAFTLLGMAPGHDDPAAPNDAVVRMLARQRGLNFAPGTEFQYNNGGYTLLAEIVTRVSGQPFAAFAEANLLKPLGMTQTHFHVDPTEIVPNRVSGYTQAGHGLRVALRSDPGGLVGNAGLFTTARDLLTWEQNFASPRVGDASIVAAMQKGIPVDDNNAYGFGLEIATYRGATVIGHGGGDPGFSAYVARYPDQGLAIAVLCNVDSIDAPTLTRRVADVMIPEALSPASASTGEATKPVAAVSLSAADLASKAGVYRDVANGTFGHFFVRDGQLRSAPGGTTDPSVALTPLSANRFVVPGTTVTLEFVPAANSKPQELHVTGAGSKPIVMQQMASGFAPSAADLRAFAGAYISPEIDMTYTIVVRDSALVLQVPGMQDIPLQPLFPDAFHGTLVDVLQFSRDAHGVVTGFTIHTNDVRSLRFDRATH